jgi:hypothetical protein
MVTYWDNIDCKKRNIVSNVSLISVSWTWSRVEHYFRDLSRAWGWGHKDGLDLVGREKHISKDNKLQVSVTNERDVVNHHVHFDQNKSSERYIHINKRATLQLKYVNTTYNIGMRRPCLSEVMYSTLTYSMRLTVSMYVTQILHVPCVSQYPCTRAMRICSTVWKGD